jgi:hypothetical protein
MTTQLFVYGVLGVATTLYAFAANRRLFEARRAGTTSLLEVLYYAFALAALVLGWYFNVRYTHAHADASYWNYTKTLFDNPASASASQDLVIFNLVLLPLWTITDGRRRGIKAPAVFFVMSLFTSLAFAAGVYLAFVERQRRYDAAFPAEASTTA